MDTTSVIIVLNLYVSVHTVTIQAVSLVCNSNYKIKKSSVYDCTVEDVE